MAVIISSLFIYLVQSSKGKWSSSPSGWNYVKLHRKFLSSRNRQSTGIKQSILSRANSNYAERDFCPGIGLIDVCIWNQDGFCRLRHLKTIESEWPRTTSLIAIFYLVCYYLVYGPFDSNSYILTKYCCLPDLIIIRHDILSRAFVVFVVCSERHCFTNK